MAHCQEDGAPPRGAGPGRFGSALGFVMVAVGAAVGLGNVWKFPYLAGANGGAVFVLLYLVFLALVALPILVAEVAIGRRGRASPPHALARQAAEFGARSGFWRAAGVVGVVMSLVIMSFYSVIGGWTILFAAEAATGFAAFADAASALAHQQALEGDPSGMLALQLLFIIATVAIVAGGVRRGIERSMRVMAPLMAVLLVIVVVYALAAGAGGRALDWLFAADWTKLDGRVALAALGQAFFTLSVGIGGMMTYGAYLPERASPLRASVAVAGADTAVALLAGLAVFPIVFAHGLDPAAGPALIFITLPIAFHAMPAGAIIGGAFFLFLFLAALTSAVALYEPFVAWRIERGASRLRATLLAAGISWLLGLVTVASFSFARDVHPLGFLGGPFAAFTAFDLITLGVDKLVLPAGALLISWFAGRIIAAPALAAVFPGDPAPLVRLLRLALKTWVPLAIMVLLAAGLVLG
ncbi:MAG: transporter [Rhodothalassiaceae bacterium]|nr:MAG: transporter [Rhodothalassiaceae bacterium]